MPGFGIDSLNIRIVLPESSSICTCYFPPISLKKLLSVTRVHMTILYNTLMLVISENIYKIMSSSENIIINNSAIKIVYETFDASCK
jgi:hypothetical protein